jgi:hypothetical protein
MMNQSRFARRFHPSRFAFQSGPSEHYQHPTPTPSFKNRIINLFRPRSVREKQARNSRASSSPGAEDRCPPCAPPAVQVVSWPYDGIPHSLRHDAHQNDTPDIVIAESGGEPSSPDFPPNILYAPRLPQLSPRWTVPNVWTDFRRLELTCPINFNDCLHILQECTLLTEFKLALVARDYLPIRSDVVARNLLSLTIISSCGTGRLFRSLTLPRLTSMHLSLELLAEPPTDIGLRSLIARSKCHLKTLSLKNVFLLERKLTACLKVVSRSLINLVVRNDTSYLGMISEDTIRLLVKKEQSSSRCCPMLRTLELSPCKSSDGLLAKMVATRLSDREFNFTYSFLDPSLHTRDTQYLTDNLNALHVIHQLCY